MVTSGVNLMQKVNKKGDRPRFPKKGDRPRFPTIRADVVELVDTLS